MIVRALVVWAAIIPIAIGNGAFREAFLLPRLGVRRGKLVSGFTLSGMVFLVTLLTIRWMGLTTVSASLGVGVLWLICTVAFECVFGHWVARKPWSVLLKAYTFRDGELWPVVLLVVTLSPYLAARLLRSL
jgi:hypothetical protein